MESPNGRDILWCFLHIQLKKIKIKTKNSILGVFQSFLIDCHWAHFGKFGKSRVDFAALAVLEKS
jgi:hypothetical protein